MGNLTPSEFAKIELKISSLVNLQIVNTCLPKCSGNDIKLDDTVTQVAKSGSVVFNEKCFVETRCAVEAGICAIAKILSNLINSNKIKISQKIIGIDPTKYVATNKVRITVSLEKLCNNIKINTIRGESEYLSNTNNGDFAFSENTKPEFKCLLFNLIQTVSVDLFNLNINSEDIKIL